MYVYERNYRGHFLIYTAQYDTPMDVCEFLEKHSNRFIVVPFVPKDENNNKINCLIYFCDLQCSLCRKGVLCIYVKLELPQNYIKLYYIFIGTILIIGSGTLSDVLGFHVRYNKDYSGNI